jgi:hypothetical protein
MKHSGNKLKTGPQIMYFNVFRVLGSIGKESMNLGDECH